jgi:hypothetical protein
MTETDRDLMPPNAEIDVQYSLQNKVPWLLAFAS